MAKRKPRKGEQLDLIDVKPKNAKQIAACAHLYKAAQIKRLRALEEEVVHKETLLQLIEKSGVQRLADGIIKLECDKYKITVKPRDELITVKERKEKKT